MDKKANKKANKRGKRKEKADKCELKGEYKDLQVRSRTVGNSDYRLREI